MFFFLMKFYENIENFNLFSLKTKNQFAVC